MRKFSKKSYGYREYHVDKKFSKKAYDKIIKKSILHPAIDILVFIAILVTATGFILNVIFGLSTTLLIIINSLASFIILIFVIELIKKYMLSNSKKEFFKYHWIDFILVSFLSIYMIFVGFLGIIKLFIFDMLKPLFHEMKDYRIMYKLFKKE